MFWLAAVEYAIQFILLLSASINNNNAEALTVEPNKPLRISIIGGGTSGMFAAAAAIESLQSSSECSTIRHNDITIEICVFEAASSILRNVPEDGNVLFDTSKNVRNILMDGYPRGRKEITSILTKSFPPIQQQAWFESKGISFSTLKDGRMVAALGKEEEKGVEVGDEVNEQSLLSSSRVLNIIANTIVNATIGLSKIYINHEVLSVQKKSPENKFILEFSEDDQPNVECDCVIIATGSLSNRGRYFAKSIGHTIIPPIRSNFGFLLHPRYHLKKGELLDGVPSDIYSAPFARLSFKVIIPGQKKATIFKREGPIDLTVVKLYPEEYNNSKNRESSSDPLTMVYLSGLAAFGLSSFAAHELQRCHYRGKVFIHFCPEMPAVEKVESFLWQYRQDHPRDCVVDKCPLSYSKVDYENYDWETGSFGTDTRACIPPALWEAMCVNCVNVKPTDKWSRLSPKVVRALAEIVVGCPLDFVGRGPSPEFINAGGIKLKEINFNSMQSKLCDGLFCCGQVLDIDGCSGGYNFMSDVATGYVAGSSAIKFARDNKN